MPEKRRTKKDAAKHFGVSTQALDAWFLAGCPVAERDDNGAIKALDLEAMNRWKRKRDLLHAMTPQQRERLDDKFHFTCEIVVPAIAEREVTHLNWVADESGVPLELVEQVWSSLTFLKFFFVADLFGKKVDDVNFHFPDSVSDKVKAIGAWTGVIHNGRKAQR